MFLLHVHSNEDPAYVFYLMLHYLANEFVFYDQGKKVKVPTFLVPATQKVGPSPHVEGNWICCKLGLAADSHNFL